MVVLLSLFGAGQSCFNNISEDDLTSYKVLLQPHDAFGFVGVRRQRVPDDETRQSRGRTSEAEESRVTMDHEACK